MGQLKEGGIENEYLQIFDIDMLPYTYTFNFNKQQCIHYIPMIFVYI